MRQRIFYIVDARPNFMKMAPILREMAKALGWYLLNKLGLAGVTDPLRAGS